MLYVDLAQYMESREIQSPRRFLVEQGFTYHTAGRLLRSELRSISYKNLEKLCLIFNCTPNDLYRWKPGTKDSGDRIALRKLYGRSGSGGILGKLKQLPDSKLEQIKSLVDRLSQEPD